MQIHDISQTIFKHSNFTLDSLYTGCISGDLCSNVTDNSKNPVDLINDQQQK